MGTSSVMTALMVCAMAGTTVGRGWAMTPATDDRPVALSTASHSTSSIPAVVQTQPTTADNAKTIEFGFEERVRNEHFDNLTDHSDLGNDEKSQYRFRTRLWIRVPLGGRIDLYAGAANESRNYAIPDLPFTNDETFVETLYVSAKLSQTASLKLGRQNLSRGDGFILMDGSPGDGSRSVYFNALTYMQTFAGGKTTFELIGASNPNHDRYLPVNHDLTKRLVEWDETLVGTYITDKHLPKTEVQAYYFHKTEKNDYRPTTNPQYQPDKRIETVGARAAHRLPKDFLLTGEFAGQWGSLDTGPSVRGWGAQANLKKAFTHAWKPTLSVGYIGLSGDDPSTTSQEGWTPVAGRWPKWSELYIYSLVPEKGVAYWTNLSMFQAEATLTPHRRIGLRGTYYKMNAFHPFSGSTAAFSTGTNRGDLYVTRADVTITPALKAHLVYESLVPGGFYTSRDRGHFFRWDISYAFSKRIRLSAVR